MKINVTWSAEENAKTAGKTCAKKAVLDLIETKLAVMFSCNKYNHEELLLGAKSILGTAPIIGCTSNEGIIVPEGYLDPKKSNFVGMMAIGDNDTKIGTGISPKIGNEREIGSFVAKQAMEKVGTDASPSYYIMFVASGDEELYAEGIKDVIGDVPCFGGSIIKDNGKIYTEDNIFSNGIAVAFFYTNKKIKNIFESKYHETINSGVITKVDNEYNLSEIDGIKALKKYCEWTDKKIKDVKGNKILKESVLKPLAVKTSDGTIAVIKQPLNGNNDYSIQLANKVYVNTAIIQMQISEKELISSAAIELRNVKKKSKNNSAGFILLNDYLTKQVIEDDIEQFARKIKNEAGDIPFIMAFTSLEFGKGKFISNHYGKLMISEIAICK